MNDRQAAAIARYYAGLLRMYFNNMYIIGYYQSMEHIILKRLFDK